MNNPYPSSLPVAASPAAVVSAQDAAIAKLEASGFSFLNWILSFDDQRIAVMGKRTRFGREYAEVSPEGEVN